MSIAVSVARRWLLWGLVVGLVLGLAPGVWAAGPCASPYIVRPGDGLIRIARQCGTTVAALKAANNLTSDLILVGQALVIPGAASVSSQAATANVCDSPYQVRRGDSLARIAQRCSTTVAALKAANGLQSDLIFPNQLLDLPGRDTTPAYVPKVVIVVVDGWRYEDTYGDPTHQNIPRLWHELRPLGVWHSRIYNLGQTLTAPGHAAILGGAWQPIPNDGTGRPTAPTLFEYFRQQTGATEAETALIHNGTTEGKAGRWAYSSAAGYGADFAARQYVVDGADFEDAKVYDLAVSALGQHPRLALIAFPAVDEWAHTGDFEGYRRAIQTVDGLIADLWAALQADPFYANQTTLFVTNDHGRRLDDFTTHGGNSLSEQHVTLLTVGPRTPAGVASATRRTLRDLAPTVGQLLGLATPFAEGNVMWEVLK